MINPIHHGDCLEVMRGMEANSVDAIVTDPPYGLEFLGKDWDRFSGKFSKDEDWEHGNLGGLPRQHHRNIKCQDCGKWVYDHPPRNCTCGGVQRQQMRFFEEFCYSWATEALRVAKPGAHLLAFGGTRTFHRLACAIEDAGWEIRDCVMWVHGQGFPKSTDISKMLDKAAGAERDRIGSKIELGIWNGKKGQPGQNEGWRRPWMQNPDSDAYHVTAPATDAARQWQGWGTALKPAWEPIILARKPLIGTIAQNVLRHGCGGLNIDQCRIGTQERTYKGSGAQPHKLNAHGKGDTGIGYMDGSSKDLEFTATGRWPSNLIHDGSEEVVELFPARTTGGQNYPTDHDQRSMFGNAKVSPTQFAGDTGSTARFFQACPDNDLEDAEARRLIYCAKASRADRNEGCEGLEEQTSREYRTGNVHNMHGGRVPDKVSRNHHPTVKPTPLMHYLCRLITPPGGLILDPFCGSGSTGKAAVLEGFRFVGIEQDAEYVAIAEARIRWAEQQPKQAELF